MSLIPTGDRVVIRPDAPEETTRFGLIIPSTAQDRVYRGTVVSSAPRMFLPGCHVLFSKYGGTEVKLDGEDFIIISERDILGVLEDV